MVKFLLERPIAVLMAFTATFLLGLVGYFSLPVSLLPDIAIPEIAVQVSGDNLSARELENSVVAPLRRQMLQVDGLKDLRSSTRDGSGTIRLSFDFGTDTDLAFIEVNEKIDAVMGSLPKEVERPKAIKASATDIPVLYLNLSLKKDRPYEKSDEEAFLQLGDVADNIIRRRIEQLPQVAMADVTGVPGRVLQIVPDLEKMTMLGLTTEDIESILEKNNVEPGSMLVRDGYYEYNVRVSSILRTPEDVKDIYFKKDGHIMQLKDFCRVDIVPRQEGGCSLVNGKQAVTLAIIKQADENMDDMKEELQKVTDYFSKLYPDVEFTVNRNQTELLDYTISNLQQNLGLGFVFILVVAIFFLGDIKSPVVIGISMVVSVVVTFILFYLFHVSMNIISLSGLILSVGMMIDSAIIVTENISQWRERGYSLRRACIKGTTEMIIPMLSSSLTTVAVFFPLIFMSGMAGALFFDQAFSVTAGLFVAYVVSILLLPVLFFLFTRWGIKKNGWMVRTFTSPLKESYFDKLYDGGIEWVFAHKKLNFTLALGTLPVCVLFFLFMQKERMPEIDHQELLMHIEWNENLHVEENVRRVNAVQKGVERLTVEHAAYVGMQDYILDSSKDLASSESELYFKTVDTETLVELQDSLHRWVAERYPRAVVQFAPPGTIFERLFVTAEPDVVAQLYLKNRQKQIDMGELNGLTDSVENATGLMVEKHPIQKKFDVLVDREKLLLYDISFNEVVKVLRSAFKENSVSTLRSFQQYLPIHIVGEEKTINDVLAETWVPLKKKTAAEESEKAEQEFVVGIPLNELVRVSQGEDLKEIVAGKNGEFVPVDFHEVKDAETLMEKVKQVVNRYGNWEVDFSGSFFSNEQTMREMVVILCVSILLMYFILAAQFESFLQPLIVLTEIPIDIAFALFSLWIFGYTLNLMSAIGIIVTCGIIINDSILKLDTINKLRQTGIPLEEAIHEAGRRRLRAIIMTSLTTILAMLPLLFSFDMGSELQKPLSVAMIGSMLIGTLVSLFIVPLFYWFIYRSKTSVVNYRK